MPDSDYADLIVLSHLRWTWVWQRPQHLVSRFAADREHRGAHTWFVEEPLADDVAEPELRHERRDGITRVWLVVPHRPDEPEHLHFGADGSGVYADMLRALLSREGTTMAPDVLVYTPMALDLARQLSPRRLIYDVMDDLSAFAKAPVGLRERQRQLLVDADVVFAGGRSLYEGIRTIRADKCHLFPSGVDASHYAPSRDLRRQRPRGTRPVAGYVGVLDERLDLELITGLAHELQDWSIRLVGPTIKIDEAALPAAPNIEYVGMVEYSELPAVMAGFDVALMPFALNEATRSISPTKTLEYLAAGLPVVSTRVADVVADYTGVVEFGDDAATFALACRGALAASHDDAVPALAEKSDWNWIAQSMAACIDAAGIQSKGPRALTESRSALALELDRAHGHAAMAAMAGMQDPGLGIHRVSLSAATELADAAVSSATPFLRAPLLARMSAVLLLHPPAGDSAGLCLTCGTVAPCETARAVKW